MSRDTILKAASRERDDGTRWSLDNLATQKWLDGHAPGAERAVGWLVDEATRLFKDGDDQAATAPRPGPQAHGRLDTAAAR